MFQTCDRPTDQNRNRASHTLNDRPQICPSERLAVRDERSRQKLTWQEQKLKASGTSPRSSDGPGLRNCGANADFLDGHRLLCYRAIHWRRLVLVRTKFQMDVCRSKTMVDTCFSTENRCRSPAKRPIDLATIGRLHSYRHTAWTGARDTASVREHTIKQTLSRCGADSWKRGQHTVCGRSSVTDAEALAHGLSADAGFWGSHVTPLLLGEGDDVSDTDGAASGAGSQTLFDAAARRRRGWSTSCWT